LTGTTSPPDRAGRLTRTRRPAKYATVRVASRMPEAEVVTLTRSRGDAMKAKKTSRNGKPAAKRASKDLAPRKSQDVKGGSFLSSIGQAIGSVGKAVDPALPAKPAK
jgi:hypothetical protein